jgi:hypothetical protein
MTLLHAARDGQHSNAATIRHGFLSQSSDPL